MSSWLYEHHFKFTGTLNKYTKFVWSGRDVWAVTPSGSSISINVFNIWDDRNVDNEKLTYHYFFDKMDDFVSPNTAAADPSFYAQTFIHQHGGTAIIPQPVKWYNRIYVQHGSDILVFDCETAQLAQTIDIDPIENGTTTIISNCDTVLVPNTESPLINSNICIANNKIFIILKNTSINDKQLFIVYDLTSDQWSTPQEMPSRNQLEQPYFMVDGLNGKVAVCAYSTNGMVWIDTTDLTTSYTSLQRQPYYTSVNQDKELFVALFRSMNLVAKIDQVNDVYEWFCSGAADYDRLFDDNQGNLWFFYDTTDNQNNKTPHIVVMKKSNLLGKSIVDWSMGKICDAFITPPLLFEYWNGSTFESKTIKPYIYVLESDDTDSQFAVKISRLNARVMENKYSVRGTAMIALGPQKYYGD